MFVFKLLLLYNYLILFCKNSEANNNNKIFDSIIFNKINENIDYEKNDRLTRSISQNDKSPENNILNKITNNKEYSIDVEDDDEDDKNSNSHQHHNHHQASHPSNNNNNNTQSNESRKKPKKNNDDLIINTESGRIRGKAFYTDHHIPRHMKPRNYPFGRKKYRVNGWLGIPYAEKPINDLRFKRPVPIKNWDGILNTTELPNTCYQVEDTVIENFEGIEIWNPNTPVSEDCLYLNVWAPHPMPKNSPVMVWIYGGGFATGTSTLKIYDPKIIVSETQLIYVSIQYRLNVFGFLYMDHENAPGNQGLIDQYLALKWVHNNIQYFGGDSTQITIFGESAGSVSVSLHLLSSLSSNLFRNAIMESGTALADWSTLKNSDAINRYTGILNHMGCNGTSYEMIECAKKIDAKTALEKADEHFYTYANHGVAQFTFLPVVDNYFLEEEPISLLNRGKFKKCPILAGANKDEGNWLFVYAFPEYRNLTVRPNFDYDTLNDFLTSLYHFYPQYPATSSAAVMNAIKYRYTNWNNVHNDDKNFENFDEAAGDFHFLCPVVDFASIYAKHKQDVFFYHFTQRSSIHFWPEWLGVMHGDEVSFVFGEPLNPEKNFTYSEKVLSRKILKYWSNFVRYENPNGPQLTSKDKIILTSNNLNEYSILDSNNNPNINDENDDNNDKKYIQTHKIVRNRPRITTQTLAQYIEPWPKFELLENSNTDDQRAYLVLNSNKLEIGYNLRAEYCAFWGSFLPNLVLSEPRCNCRTCPATANAQSSSSSLGNGGIALLLNLNWLSIVYLNSHNFFILIMYKINFY